MVSSFAVPVPYVIPVSTDTVSVVSVTPGVTVALRGSFDPLKVPRLDHDKIISYLRPKGPKLCHRSGISIFDESDEAEKDDKEEPDDGSCFHMVNAYYFAALRSRTPTSAGMMGVSPDDMQLMLVKKQPILTYAMWVLMVREFGVSNKTLIGTNEYFAKHVYDIAEENARGQCTRGHSCKVSHSVLMCNLLKATFIGSSKYRVVTRHRAKIYFNNMLI